MIKKRKKKLVYILILLVAITGLSIGLATFSSVLTISSSATVKPNAGEYKLTIYGFTEDPLRLLLGSSSPETLDELLLNHVSTTYSVPGEIYTNTKASSATIDNNTHTIKDISVSIVYDQNFQGTSSGINYIFILINEGANDIYFNTSQIIELISSDKTGICTTANPEKETLINEYCNNIYQNIELGVITPDMDFIDITEEQLAMNDIKLSPGDNIVLNMAIVSGVDKNIVDSTGEFTVKFEDIILPFGSTSPSSGE